jgi:ribose transport system substrate-binding protein
MDRNMGGARALAGIVAAAFAVGGAMAETARADGVQDFNKKVDGLVAQYVAPQKAAPPTSGPPPAKGKTIVIITCSMAAEGCARMSRGSEEAAALLGWKSILIDAVGDPAKMADGVRRAISVKADGILLQGVDAEVIPSALEQAKAAGIHIISGDGDDGTGKFFEAIEPVPASFETGGYMAAATAYKMAGYKLAALEMHDDEFSAVVSRFKGVNRFIKECADAGGDCKVLATDNCLVADLTTRLPQQAISLVRRHPDYNVLFGGFDAQLNFMIQGLTQAGLTHKGFSAGFDANVANLDIIRQDGYQRLSVGGPAEWIGYANVDDLNRILAGQKPVDQGLNQKVLIKDNLPASGAWVGDVDYQAAYKKLWGLQ